MAPFSRLVPLGLVLLALVIIPTLRNFPTIISYDEGPAAAPTPAGSEPLSRVAALRARERDLATRLGSLNGTLSIARTRLAAAAVHTRHAVPAPADPAPATYPLDGAGGHACVGGCGRGTCNADLGRCDCPPFAKGAGCAEPLFPACVDQYGLKPAVAACGIHSQPAFPATCDCVMQCHELALDARQECVVAPAPGESMAAAERRTKAAIPWSPIIANETWLQWTRADAAASLADGHCSGRGILSVQLPYQFYPKELDCVPSDRRYNLEECANQRTPKCRCFPGFTGPTCNVKMDESPGLHKCFNECSGRGACEHNFCRCEPGSWGIDCSLGPGSGGAGGGASGGGAGGSRARGAAATADGGVRPLIYVYDMPPRFTSWLAAYRKGDWSRDHWYGVDVMLHQQLLRSAHRTLDPGRADYFFIPLHLSLGYYSHRYYFKHFTQPAHKPLRDAIAYVKRTWPYFARRGGADHIVVMTQDQGNRFVRQQVPESRPLIMLHHWGAPASVKVDSDGQGDHVAGKDFCVPPFHGEQARMNRWLPATLNSEHGGCMGTDGKPTARCARPSISRAQLGAPLDEAAFKRELFFSGKMNLNWGRHYSLGVRQAAYRAHRANPRVLIMTFDNGVYEKLPLEQHVANYATSKFCLAPAGYGFSSRQYECVLVGCVPVVIQDDVEMAFETILPWRRFSVRLRFDDIPILPQLLAKIPARHVARLRRGLGCVWPRMLWLAPGLYEQRVDADATLHAARPYDAFDTTMWALRARLDNRTGSSSSSGRRGGGSGGGSGGGGGGSGGDGTGGGWRAPLDSCVQMAGDEEELDLDALRAETRREMAAGAFALSKNASLVADIIADFARTHDDKEFAMKTRFFPSGVKTPGIKWTD